MEPCGQPVAGINTNGPLFFCFACTDYASCSQKRQETLPIPAQLVAAQQPWLCAQTLLAMRLPLRLCRELLGSLSSVEDIDKRMAELSSQGKIDPAFLQISAKAYGAARDTNMTLDEVHTQLSMH